MPEIDKIINDIKVWANTHTTKHLCMPVASREIADLIVSSVSDICTAKVISVGLNTYFSITFTRSRKLLEELNKLDSQVPIKTRPRGNYP